MDRYPNLVAFVKENIVPSELADIDSVSDVYVTLIMKAIEDSNECTGLDALIHNISPYPPYIDSGCSEIMNYCTTELTGSDLVKELREALKADEIECQIPDGTGF